jgi:hypothetical protein
MTTEPVVTTTPTANRPDRSVLIIAGLIVALVVAAVAAALTLGSRPPTTYPPDSPEGVFQAYVRAVEARQPEVAYSHFSKRVKGLMTLEQYQKEYGRPVVTRERNSRLRIDRVEVTGDRATLYVTTEFVSGSGLDASRSSWTQQVQLIREDGAWTIDERLGWVD